MPQESSQNSPQDSSQDSPQDFSKKLAQDSAQDSAHYSAQLLGFESELKLILDLNLNWNIKNESSKDYFLFPGYLKGKNRRPLAVANLSFFSYKNCITI